MKTSDLTNRINELIAKAKIVASTTHARRGLERVDFEQFAELRASALSFIKMTFGGSHPFYKDFDEKVKDPFSSQTKYAVGILKSAEDEIKNGWIFRLKNLVSSEIFSDFLEMAEYLLAEGYKDAAAVIIGSTLEEHLRQLCKKNLINIEYKKDGKSIPKKADILNAELAKAEIYNKTEMKGVTGHLGLRNDAAHGNYDQYNKEQVQLMCQAVLDFMNRNSI